MKIRAKHFWILILTICQIWSSAFEIYAEIPENPASPGSLYALSAVLMDGDSGRILYEKNGNEIRPMASTTKIMTCILILEYGNTEDTAVASSYAASMPKVHLGVSAGEEFRVKDLLYSLMLESHNDTAVILAEYLCKSVEAFAGKMNEKAAEIGCKNTCFITPNGLDAQKETTGEVKKHSTTASDLARIMRYCIQESEKKEEFLEITRTASYSFSDTAGNRNFSCVNHNTFLGMMEGALSGKTGFTSGAGYCYVGALKRDGKTFIVALLGCGWPNHKSYKWQDTRKLMEYGLKEYEIHSFSEAALPRIPSSVKVTDGQSPVLGETAKVSAVREKKEDVSLLLRKDEEIITVYHGSSELDAPVKKGEKIGEIEFRLDGRVWKTENVVAGSQVEKVDYIWCLREIVKRMLPGV